MKGEAEVKSLHAYMNKENIFSAPDSNSFFQIAIISWNA